MNCGAHFCFTKKCLFKTRTRSVTAVMQPRSAGEFCLLLFTTDFLRLPLSLSLPLSFCLLLLPFAFLIGGPTTGSESNRGAS